MGNISKTIGMLGGGNALACDLGTIVAYKDATTIQLSKRFMPTADNIVF
jgi:hypothetical protein